MTTGSHFGMVDGDFCIMEKMMKHRWISPLARLLIGAALLCCAGWLSGCQTTRYYERRKIADRCMQIDSNGRLVYIRNKIEAAREGGLGGFGSASAGGCGCQ